MKSLKEIFKAFPRNFMQELKAEKQRFNLDYYVKNIMLSIVFLIVLSLCTILFSTVLGTGIIFSFVMAVVGAVLMMMYKVTDRAIDKSA